MIHRVIGLLLLVLSGAWAGAAEVVPPPPPRHFNDFAGLVRPSTTEALDLELGQFERQTSNQVVVAIYPKMESDSSIEDYTVRVAQSWRAGLKGRDNGAVLFVFAQNHTMYLQVGYGLEGAIPDAVAKRIIDDTIRPFFQRGDFDGGMKAAVTAIMAAARGEYQGTGRTVSERRGGHGAPGSLIFALFAVFILFSIIRHRMGSVYNGAGRRGFGAGMITGMFLGGGGGFGGGGGGGGFGGGGFSGGGGGFGGGGAGGSW